MRCPDAVLTLRPEPQAVAVARQLTREACHDAQLDGDFCDTAVLLTSETVTNAVIHARSEVRIAVYTDRSGIRVEVRDADGRPPIPYAASDESVHGRGVNIVASAATRWGVDDVTDGKIVWFELAT